MNAQGSHHVDLHVAVEQHVKAIEPPAERSGDQRALLRGSDFREGGCGGGHWLGGFYHLSAISPRRRGDAETRRDCPSEIPSEARIHMIVQKRLGSYIRR